MLFDYANGWLVGHKVLLPGVTVLERFIAEACSRMESRLCQGEAHRGFWELIVEMRDDPVFEPIEWSHEDANAWRDRRPTQAFTWPE